MVRTMVWCGRGCQNHSFSGTWIFSILGSILKHFGANMDPKSDVDSSWKLYMAILALLVGYVDTMWFLSNPGQGQESWVGQALKLNRSVSGAQYQQITDYNC